MFPNFKSAVGKAALLAFVLGLMATVLSQGSFAQTGGMTALFSDDFEDGTADDWELETGWRIELEGGNHVLSGKGHSWARPVRSEGWGTITSFETRIKRIEGGVHLNFRVGSMGTRYFVGVNENRLYLNKSILKDPALTEGGPLDHVELMGVDLRLDATWHAIKITGNGDNLKVYIDGQLKIDYIDEEDPHLSGSVAFETLPDSHLYFDDVVVMGETPPKPPPGYVWKKLGGPSGGLGYDVRMHPGNPDIMYVTDAWSGVNKSTDGGLTWHASNQGIVTRTGPSGDAIPVFSLTIDPHNPDVIWAGTQGTRGIYKSTDGSLTWTRKDRGVVENEGISFRGFTVDPSNSDIVYAAAEISSFAWASRNIPGREFDLTQGVVYKTIDGGENWQAVWRGDNLARYIWIDPRDTDVIYISTGIFDREAANSDPATNTPGGVGILKSTDGGKTWFQVNNGLDNLYIGTLFMHPENPDILLAGAGNNAYRDGGGIYLTTDGGAHWEHMDGRHITSVEFAAGNPDVAYASSGEDKFYRSDDGGHTWQPYERPGEKGWGPEGIRPGFPIDFQVDPRDVNRIFVNNYGGGNLLSEDGGQTWRSASKGYTGAQLHDIVVAPNAPGLVYTIGRSGPFRSVNGGEDWRGIAFSPAMFAEWNAVATNPENPWEVLIADEFEGSLLRSRDGGNTWALVFQHPLAKGGGPGNRHGFKAIAYAPSDPQVVYAGMRKGRRSINGDFPPESSFGVYRSTDGGLTWHERNDSHTASRNINVLVVDPRDSNVVYAATFKGGVFKSIDGGESWQPMSEGLRVLDVRALVIDPQNPEVLYAGVENGGVYKSVNGGNSWQRSSSGLDPQAAIRAIVVDPADPTTLYAADFHTGVYHSENGGQLWMRINDGLSTRAVKALAISSDGKVVYAATEGEGVFRLGEPPEVVAPPPTTSPATQPPTLITPPTNQPPVIATPPTTEPTTTTTEKTGNILPYLGGGLLLLVLIGWGFWRWHYHRKIVQ